MINTDSPSQSFPGKWFLARWPLTIFLPFILVLNALIFPHLAFMEFSDMDWGGFLDASWRVFTGQKVYHDFFYHSGPVHLYMNAFFFHLFGFGKNAILAHLVLVNSLMVLATFFATYRRVPVFFTLLTTLHTLTCFYWIYPHPYYDYSAHFWGLLGVFVIARFPPFAGRQAFTAAFFCGAMAVLSGLTKINIGAAYALVFLAVFSTLPKRLAAWAGFFLGGLAALACVLSTVYSVTEMIESIRDFSGVVSDRLIRFLLLPVYIKNFFWVPLLAVYFATSSRKMEVLPLYTLFVGVFFVAIFSINTGSFQGWDYLPMMGMYLGLAFLILFRFLTPSTGRLRRYFILAGIFLSSAVAVYQIYSASWVCAVRVAKQVDIGAEDRYYLKAKPFKGWLFTRERGIVLDAIVEYINENVPKNETLLILSYMQVVYPLTGRDSFRGITFHWYPGSVPAPGRQWQKVRAAIVDHPPDWILTYRDGQSSKALNEIVQYLKIPVEPIAANYEVVQSWNEHALLRRRK